MQLDLQRIVENMIVALIAGFVGWGVGALIKLRRDINAAWGRLRALERRLGSGEGKE